MYMNDVRAGAWKRGGNAPFFGLIEIGGCASEPVPSGRYELAQGQKIEAEYWARPIPIRIEAEDHALQAPNCGLPEVKRQGGGGGWTITSQRGTAGGHLIVSHSRRLDAVTWHNEICRALRAAAQDDDETQGNGGSTPCERESGSSCAGEQQSQSVDSPS